MRFTGKLGTANSKLGSIVLASDGPESTPQFHLTATTSEANTTVIIDMLRVSEATTLDWGDSSPADTLSADSEDSLVHEYAQAGTYTITLADARLVTGLALYEWDGLISGLDTAELQDAQLSLFDVEYLAGCTVRSVDMRNWPVDEFWLYCMIDGTFEIDTADMADWRPTNWDIDTMPEGSYRISTADMANWELERWYLGLMPEGDYTVDSAHMTGWAPVVWYLEFMPAGSYRISSADMVDWRPNRWTLGIDAAGTYAIDTAHMADWAPSQWLLHHLPSGSFVVDADDMALWTPRDWGLYEIGAGCTGLAGLVTSWAPTLMLLHYYSLVPVVTGGELDTLLAAIYAARADFPETDLDEGKGILEIAGTNAAPGGIYRDAVPPTTGKEYIYKLVNDPDGEGFNLWTITYNESTALNVVPLCMYYARRRRSA